MKILILLIAIFSLNQVCATEKTRIVFLAGAPSLPHASGTHEFNAGAQLLANVLNNESALNLNVTVYASEWPTDPALYKNVKAVVVYMDGGEAHPVNSRLDELGALMSQGVGFVCLHYCVIVPKGKPSESFTKWIGGYYESGWSFNPHWTVNAKFNNAHPVQQGVQPFSLKDEWYFNIRFGSESGLPSVTPILQGIPDKAARSGDTAWPRGEKKHIVDAAGNIETLMWAIERKDGGRGVGFTGGHYHENWANDNFRKLVLNAIVWAAGISIPANGVHSGSISELAINKNLDEKPTSTYITLKK